MPGVLFSDLPAQVIPKLQSALDARPEPYAAAMVADKVVPGEPRMVTINLGPSPGTFDTLDDTSLRVNVRAVDAGEAVDLAYMVRALFEAPAPAGIRDGDPIVAASVNAGPIEVPNETDLFQWYLVIDITRRGTPLT